ncbi:CIC family chloride channel protein [Mucilaginibacter frigoritolerans]|uniref:CIC family chloride channel protein n=1 Tax=Mucilaginibacter frigoritolerans TaxID=652788 RepID=A0A562TTV4_9SPHI|nr:chloride channel protein [Mucilaginibacter frigoritolerans]TWI96668.1 CIC family chloride channel protein [Mucilaginibacter frigoritolerans]
MLKKLSYKIKKWRLRQNSQRNFLIYCSVFVGFFGGLAAVALKFLVRTMEEVSRNISSHLPYHIIYVFLPALGIFLTVAYQHLLNRDKIQKGIGNILVNIKRNRSNIRYNNIYSHLITSSLTVGFGGSSGLEAPIVATGAAIGSNTGKFFNLSPYEKTVLLAAGASAGIAAVFNSPIAGVLFSLEILIGEITIPTFIPLLIASATGVVVSKLLYSGQLFHLVTEGWAFKALPFYILLGLFSGYISVYISKVGGALEKGILKKQNRYVRALAGGLFLGLIIMIFPALFGEGYHYLQEILNGNINSLKEESFFSSWLTQPIVMIIFIACLVFMKIIAAGITIGSGGNGGTFAPTMFTGAFLGLFVAFAVNQTGLVHLNTSNFIAVGMAGALSGVLHAPLTSIFLIAEITGGYVLFIPLMIVASISYIIARLYNPHNMYWHDLIHEKNIHPDQDYDMLNAITLASVVNKQFTAISSETKISDFYKILSSTNANIFAVLDEQKNLEGVIWLDQVRKHIFEKINDDDTVAEIMVIPPAIVNYDASVNSVMDLFDKTDVWQLPVIKDGVFIGFVSKSTLLTKYREEFIRQHREADLFSHA